MPARDTERARERAVRHPLFARFYERQSEAADVRMGVRAHREELLSGLTGRVIEIGAGNGLNFARYPPGVSEVIAVEPEPRLRGAATAAAGKAPVPVHVVDGTAQALPAADASCDAAVCSLVMCSLPDVPLALDEVRRVLRPGGELRFYEHGRAEDRPGMLRFQRVLDATVWPLLLGGCHTSRDPVGLIKEAGFTDVSFRRLVVPQDGPVLPSSFHVLGSARRP
ncbi:methyltransferase type 11 [Streptomyces abyssalis]|uniref:Methyltransferase type 11 n=1 Tax=Streptomyces abyssalis TaxID=933944 RepID=A0A1E7JVH6_9ACTN|nr:class I SAM-dependent methyltransferase [Streptomyces abyssalis]OEU94486.1 methyltransferase type 11 [Streptomyces abyssalis]OEU95869.1 methyltransferase type 11 [Streptomyces abyssalis]